MALKINLCGHPVRIEGYVNVDMSPFSEVEVDLEKELIPLDDHCADVVVCNSAINYFSKERGRELIGDVFRVLKPGGLVRFGALDLEVITRCYIERDEAFYFEKQANGEDRYPGETFCEKLNEFFSGHAIGDKSGKFVYDYETLSRCFGEAGFVSVERKQYLQSALPEVAQVDNRPEQMFFLEARKPRTTGSEQRDPETSGRFLEKAQALITDGKNLAAWQYLLAAREADGTNRSCVDAILVETRRLRPSSGVTLLREHLACRHEEETRAGELEREVRVAAKFDEPLENEAAVREAVADPALRNVVNGDGAHLKGGMEWLARAQDRTSDGGVSAMYDILRRRWDLSYPETTGYCIPTFLAYSEHTGEPVWRERAERMASFLTQCVLPNGGLGEPVGLYAGHPRVFNTSQAMLGFIALYRKTGDSRYLEQAVAFGGFIVDTLDEDGKFLEYTYQGNKSHKVRTAWVLLELWKETDDARWRDAASVIWKRVLHLARNNGWFANTSLLTPNRPWTHLLGYTLGAFEEIRHLMPDAPDGERIDLILSATAEIVTRKYEDARERGMGFAGLRGTYDWNWGSADSWACVTGTVQFGFFMRRIGVRLDKPAWVDASDWLVAETKRVQFMGQGEDPDLQGGLPGSDPLDGGYLPWRQPNWGVKFFADALLLSMESDVEGLCLG